MKKQSMKVVSQAEIAKNIYELVLEGELVADMQEAGQFVHLKVDESTDPLLRRPISICDIDQENQRFTMIYRAEGKGTTLLSKKKENDAVDVLGPLGSGFPIDEMEAGETALLVGGGIGVPPLYNLSKRLVEKGVNVIHVFGFQDKSVMFYEEKFKELGPTYIATVDGSYGKQGFVTDVISLENIQFECLFACGPTPMLRALDERFHDKKGFMSLEERMGCGIGACFACVCHLQEDPSGASYRKVCSDGPVFPIGEVLI
ncbi:MAG TPA: dihydroorotate dehydrogenase electron transfer subunit [Bacillales bacterium]|nr:dihydroorotate dehydrogenase electron transfer subunit [Bacillales bacterium]